MSKTAEAIKKVPAECCATINTFGSLIQYAMQNEKAPQEEEMRRKLRGYLTCLVDMGKLTENEARIVNLWVAGGHKIGVQEGTTNA